MNLKKNENDLDLSIALENIDTCIAMIKAQFAYEGNINNPPNGYWLLQDGSILDCKAHGNIDFFLIKQNMISSASKHFNVYEGSRFMDELNAVRIRNEVPWDNLPSYLTLPKAELSEVQYTITNQWIQDILLNIKTYLIIDFGTETKEYHLLEDKEAILDIKKHYRKES